MFFYKNCEVLNNIIFQNTATQLLQISCNIFNVSLALSVTNQFSHS